MCNLSSYEQNVVMINLWSGPLDNSYWLGALTFSEPLFIAFVSGTFYAFFTLDLNITLRQHPAMYNVSNCTNLNYNILNRSSDLVAID